MAPKFYRATLLTPHTRDPRNAGVVCNTQSPAVIEQFIDLQRKANSGFKPGECKVEVVEIEQVKVREVEW